MRRFFAKNLLFTLIVNVLVMPIWVIFIDRTVQNRVGEHSYGTYTPLLGLSLVFAVLLDLGITNFNTRSIAQNPQGLKEQFPAMFSARLVLVLIYMAVLAIAGIVSGYDRWEMSMLLGIGLIQVMLNTVLFLRSNVAALQKFKLDSVLSVSGRLLMIVVCGFLLIYPRTAHVFRIEWFVITQIICYSITAVIAYLALRRLQHVRLRFALNGAQLWSIIRNTFPYALLVFLMSIYTRFDVYLIKQLLGPDGPAQANVYYAAYRWLDVGNNFGLLFAGILLPLFGRMLIQKENVASIITLCVNILLPISLMIAVASYYWGSPIMHKLYHAATDSYGAVLFWVMTAFPAFCMMYVYSTLLTANGNLKLLNKIAFLGCVVSISLNLYMIPHYQALGAAITGGITQWTVALCYIYFACKTIKVPLPLRWALVHLCYVVLIIAMGWGITRLPLSWLMQAVAFVIACGALMMLFRFISVKDAVQLIAKRQS